MSNNLNILLTTPDYGTTGGIQTVTRNLKLGLEKLGQNVEILHVESGGSYGPRCYVPRFRWINTVDDFRRGLWPYRHQVYTQADERMDRFNPHIVHSLHVQHYPAVIRAAERDIPTVISTHALELEDEAATRVAVSRASKVHTVSDFTAGLVEEITGNDDTSPSYTVPPSIDIGTYARSNEADSTVPQPDAPVVTLGRLEKGRKNFETVIEAWNLLPKSVTNRRKLIVAGDGPHRDTLERMVRPRRDVEFVGYLSEDEKRELLQEASVFAFVPRKVGYDVEGFGIVYIEAQAAATPVVGSLHGGAPEAVGDGGLLVEDESDPAAVATAIETLVTDRHVRQQCLRAISRRIGAFDLEPIASNHLNAYLELSS